MAAVDVTNLYENARELQRENENLMEVNRKLRSMYERISDSVREQETLAMKRKIHDDLGAVCLYTKTSGWKQGDGNTRTAERIKKRR